MLLLLKHVEKNEFKLKYKTHIYGNNDGTNATPFSLKDPYLYGKTYEETLIEERLLPALIVRCNTYGEKYYYEVEKID